MKKRRRQSPVGVFIRRVVVIIHRRNIHDWMCKVELRLALLIGFETGRIEPRNWYRIGRILVGFWLFFPVQPTFAHIEGRF